MDHKFYRIRKAEEDGELVVDVSYLFRKYQRLRDAGENVRFPSIPPVPISGWSKMTKDNYEALAPSIPPVTHGNYFKYFT